jgi:hypothetical protein
MPAGAPSLLRRSVTVDKNATPGEILLIGAVGSLVGAVLMMNEAKTRA